MLKNSKNSQASEKINVHFIYNGSKYNILSEKDQLFGSLFKRFQDTIGDYTTKFDYYSDGFLEPQMKLNEKNLHDSYYFTVNVVSVGDVISGSDFVLNFTDLGKQIYEEHYFSESAPSYRYVTQGINIYGICIRKRCKLYGKEAIVPLKGVKKFNLIEERENLECPECGAVISPKTVGFYYCEYNVKGAKYENKKTEPFEFKGKAANKNSIQYYNPDKNGKTTLAELIIEVTKFL